METVYKEWVKVKHSYIIIDVEYIYGFVWWGGLQAKSVTSQRNRAEPSQDGGYALLWQRYDNNKMVAMRYYGNVMLFYIFNSTVINWTCYMFFYVAIWWKVANNYMFRP